jgi:hypothetical protein
MRLLALVPVLLATLAGGAAARGATGAPFCNGAQLSGTFRPIPGSAGAGSVVYALRLRNRSAQRCGVTGLPVVQLLGRTGAPLPTRVQPAKQSELIPVLVTLGRGRGAKATARFSPDVPGPGEPVLAGGQCEPTAYRLRVAALGGGATTVSVTPPTPVCEHGSLQLSAYRKS